MIQQQSYHNDGGKLYLVPTPIGNLEDMTYRAVRILNEVSLILAEDTRHTIKLLNHFDIKCPMTSFHEHSSSQQVEQLIERLKEGTTMALVSDAGMPLINDPGHPLVVQALAEKIAVIALPGASAAITALVASGLNTERFTYYGFFPRDTKSQKLLLSQVGTRDETAIFYESPFRVLKTLKALEKTMPTQTKVVLAREISKQYETYIRGSLAEVIEFMTENEPRGEFVLLIEGNTLQQVNEIAASIDHQLPLAEQVAQWMVQYGVSSKEAIKEVAKLNGLRKQQVYSAYHDQTA